jgi:hypothetical protein
MFIIKFISVFLLLFIFSKPVWAWQLHNLSNETRLFDEYHKSQTLTYTKTAKPGGWLNFANNANITVVDRKTGQTINNTSFKMMIITKEGNLMYR